MNRSDLSEDDHNTSTNSTRGGNGADEVEEADYNSKYVPPKNVPIVEIWNKDSDDPSLNKYKQQLIGSAINIIIGMRVFICPSQFNLTYLYLLFIDRFNL